MIFAGPADQGENLWTTDKGPDDQEVEMEDQDLEGRVARLEEVIQELTKVVYSHAFALASLSREFGVHYHVYEGKTLPKILTSGAPLFSTVTKVSPPAVDPRPQIEGFERDPQAFLRESYSDLFYWPWE